MIDEKKLVYTFIFKDKLYKQTNEVRIGGCVPPTLAEVCISHYETLWLNICPSEFKHMLHRRYVDDSFYYFDLNRI